jgi:hypothetical protein
MHHSKRDKDWSQKKIWISCQGCTAIKVGVECKLALLHPAKLEPKHPTSGMDDQHDQRRSSNTSRLGRSRLGCLTCKRRKVRCNEQRPRCSHCERLNLQCTWKSNATLGLVARSRQAASQDAGSANIQHSSNQDVESNVAVTSQVALNESAWSSGAGHDPVATSTLPITIQQPPAVDNFFDYAGFMWDNTEWWQQFQPSDVLLPSIHPDHTVSGHFSSPSTNSPSFTITNEARRIESSAANQNGNGNAQDSVPTGDQHLLDYFVYSAVPPILAPVETQQQWSTMRRHLVSMARESSMVNSALLGFSDLLLRRRRQGLHTANEGQKHLQESARELSRYANSPESSQPSRVHLLATCFFLSYVDILEGRTESAHGSLKLAYNIFDKGEKASFSPLEVRILSWLRLLDGRAVSAGGEGLFLSDDEASEMLVQPSPAGLDNLPKTADATNVADQDAEIEDVLFQALYQPGAVFFQKVQSFMGRISKIDPWHRSRGTVTDETEVMIIAAKITRDLDKLFESRPRLMDYAAKGQLTPRHLSPHLSHTITRAFRTYASNFYASKVHLHRVAYKTLPLAMETVLALAKIKELTRMMVDMPSEIGPGSGEPLPVNMLWPLLMLGSEEEDTQERTWIRSQICRMQEVATNAEMTAQVLDEVQKMQDSTKIRVDIRSVMHKIFDACFAIV